VRRAALLAGALTLAGCATSSVVLLPDEGGGNGAIRVRPASGTAVVMNQANSRASLGTTRATVRALGAKGLKPNEAALLASLPPPARSFTLYFREGTTDLLPESVPMLEQVRAEVARRPGAEVQVTGHTDTVGSDADNDRLSRQRAAQILNLLASKGFSRSIMSAVGRGERELKAQTADNVPSPINRRVEIIVR
jgi:outer membrane protein OmpA-like peptidoglycan-associated protein